MTVHIGRNARVLVSVDRSDLWPDVENPAHNVYDKTSRTSGQPIAEAVRRRDAGLCARCARSRKHPSHNGVQSYQCRCGYDAQQDPEMFRHDDEVALGRHFDARALGSWVRHHAHAGDTGERVRIMRDIGAALRPLCPEAADILESYAAYADEVER
jgi:hypothetical protein